VGVTVEACPAVPSLKWLPAHLRWRDIEVASALKEIGAFSE
jgi:hypothetical protein